MNLWISIDEEIYRHAQNVSEDSNDEWNAMRAIANGTPLPKGHGRLIDESQITGTFTWDNGYIECFAPTIIEADEAESEE